jgi:hypothetical protein
MMSRVGWLTGSGLILSAIGAWALADRPRPTPANWIADYGRAKTLARQAGKPIFLTLH